METHSMCQPGLPWPSSVSQAGSSGRAACQSTGSNGLRFPGRCGSPPRCPNSAAIVCWSSPDTDPKVGSAVMSKYRSPST